MTLILQTKNLTFSEFNYHDGLFLVELLNSPNWLKYIGARGVNNELDAIQYIKNVYQKSYQQNGFGFYKVAITATNQPIGLCGIVKRDSLDDIDIGFAFLPAFAGQGFGYEAANATLEYAFNQLNISKIVAMVMPENEVSIALIKKIGMLFTKNIKLPNEDKELMLFEKTRD